MSESEGEREIVCVRENEIERGGGGVSEGKREREAPK